MDIKKLIVFIERENIKRNNYEKQSEKVEKTIMESNRVIESNRE